MAEIKLDTFSMQTQGDIPKLGDKAPNFILAKHDMMPVGLADFKGQHLLLNIFPSIDTETCFCSVEYFCQWAKQNHRDDLAIACVSMDLPYALDRVRTREGFVSLNLLSDFRDHLFGLDYGVLIDTGPLAGLLARAVVLIDKEQTVRYVELVKDVSKPCDYDAAVAALASLNS